MLIRWATADDKPSWTRLAEEVAEIFGNPSMATDPDFLAYMDGKLSKYEALAAQDRRSGEILGVIGFSRTHNRITWFGVFEKHRGRGIGARLLATALRHLDNTKDVTVETYRADYTPGLPARAVYHKLGFGDSDSTITDHLGNPRCKMVLPPDGKKRGKSFHRRYPEFIKAANKAHCPACNNEPAPDDQHPIDVTEQVWIVAEYPGQGRLFGKMYVMPRSHVFHFEDMRSEDAAAFMSEVQRVGRALRKVTGAEKINYEMHSNTGAHLHIHLCPRYLDDDFPGLAIDLSCPSDPSPYEDYDEFLWFVRQMRTELGVSQPSNTTKNR